MGTATWRKKFWRHKSKMSLQKKDMRKIQITMQKYININLELEIEKFNGCATFYSISLIKSAFISNACSFISSFIFSLSLVRPNVQPRGHNSSLLQWIQMVSRKTNKIAGHPWHSSTTVASSYFRQRCPTFENDKNTVTAGRQARCAALYKKVF